MPRKTVVQPEVNEVEELKKQLQLMMEQLSKLQSEKVATPVARVEEFEDDDELNEVKISGDDYIKVMSLYFSILNLTTQPKGKGKIFTFHKFGEVKRIQYKDLIDIIENHHNFLEQMYFIILNKKVVRRHGLDELYSKALTKDNIERIILGENQTDAINMFKTANPTQQNIICTMIIDKMVSGQPMDLNLLDRMSRIVGYNIAERAEEAKTFAQLKNEEQE